MKFAVEVEQRRITTVYVDAKTKSEAEEVGWELAVDEGVWDDYEDDDATARPVSKFQPGTRYWSAKNGWYEIES